MGAPPSLAVAGQEGVYLGLLRVREIGTKVLHGYEVCKYVAVAAQTCAR